VGRQGPAAAHRQRFIESGQADDAVIAAFSAADAEAAPLEVDVFDAQIEWLANTQTTTVQKAGHHN
jgi:hypothetical protein